MVLKKTAIDSPFDALQELLVETVATAQATDQGKADWIDAYVDTFSPIVFSGMYSRGGSAPHPPAQMFKLTIYQILKQHLSPSKWAREVLSDSIMQKLIGHIKPSRTALYNFRERVGKIIDIVFQHLLVQSIDHGILDPTVGVIDGTSVRSYGSSHRIVDEQKAKMTDEISKSSRAIRAQTIKRANTDLKQRIGLRRLGAVTLRRAKNFVTLNLFVLNLMTVRRLLIQASKPNPEST